MGGGGSFWSLERGHPVTAERAWVTQREAQRKQPKGLMGADEVLWTVLGDYAGRIDCSGLCLPSTETQTLKCQACDLKASPSSQ